MFSFDVSPFTAELTSRIETIRRILNAAHPTVPAVPDISREVRGLAIVLLFASYENLLKTLCRGLIENARKLRVGNRRLRTGLRIFAVYGDLQSILGGPERKIWSEGKRVLESASASSSCTLNADLFPADGSFMKTTQVWLVCELFGIGDPGPILREVWGRLDTIVSQRNLIAHGAVKPEEVGRNYTAAELNTLVDLWELRWTDFLKHVETLASSRDFYRSS